MPRGVYDRTKKSDKTGKTSKTPKMATNQEMASTNAPKKTKRISKEKRTDPLTELSVVDRFSLITANILTLGQIRTLSISEDLAREIEDELRQHVTVLRNMRQQIFGGDTDVEEVCQQTIPTNGGLPFPANPLIPVPPSSPHTS